MAQFTVSNRRLLRRLSCWIARATSSLPVPDSPTIKTGTSIGAIRSIRRKSACIAALRPISPWNEGGSLISIPARLPESGRPRGPGQNNVQPHEGGLG